MSSPKNPLQERNSYATYFVIEAFAKTDEAEAAAPNITLEHGPEGEKINNGIVVVNDSIFKGAAPTKFLVKKFKMNFVWSGNHIDTSISGGSVVISDSSDGEFLTFLKQDVIPELNSTSLENITFVLKVFWNDSEANEVSPNASEPLIASEPLFFSIAQIEHKIRHNNHFYDCDIIPLYNTKAQYVNYSRVYGMTVTHESGNIHEEIPTPKPAGGSIKPRGTEDGEKTSERKNRMDKSKPMKTLGDAFKALEKELNESTKIHQIQLQEWQKVIRDDYIQKLKTPEQKKDIPIKYNITVEDGYDAYNIDNRKLPYEQPEQRQKEIGIRTIPTQYGETIDDVIDRIMRLSKQVGVDSTKEEGPPKDYKVCKVWRRIGDEVYYDIVIKKYVVPFNSPNDINTGSGESDVEALTFYFKVEDEDVDVLKFDGILHRSDALEVIEDVDDIEKAKLSFGAEREPITAERERETPYFETGYSGHRAKVSNHKVFGAEYPKELADSIKRKYAAQNVQQSAIDITIPGNPHLLSDILRRPSEVVDGKHENAEYYRRPEVLPMYAKIMIKHAPLDGETESPDFYHQKWMHIYKIENIISDGIFFQKLTLLRMDDMV